VRLLAVADEDDARVDPCAIGRRQPRAIGRRARLRRAATAASETIAGHAKRRVAVEQHVDLRRWCKVRRDHLGLDTLGHIVDDRVAIEVEDPWAGLSAALEQ